MSKELIEQKLKKIVNLLPETPGVYQYLDKDGVIIYVGKAINLKKRVSSYFYKRADHPPKVRVMVSKIVDIRHINVPTERDALLLENNLIKELRPRYNISLKDDKTYPWLCVSKEDFPRIYQSRKVDKSKAYYFGPYPNNVVLKTLLSFIEANYPIRTCKLKFSEASLQKRTYKVCVKYHIKSCLGPCAKLQSKSAYNEMISQVHMILNGNTKEVEKMLLADIKRASDSYNYEEAQRLYKNVQLLRTYKEKTIIEAQLKGELSAISYVQDEQVVYASFIQAVDGRIIKSYTCHFVVNLEVSSEEIYSSILGQVLSLYDDLTGVLLLNQPIDLNNYTLDVVVPSRGDKLKLLLFAEKTAKQYRDEMKNRELLLNPGIRYEKPLITLQQVLGMDRIPNHIECFDNSNIQGQHPVAACVVFKAGKPSKKDYRHFNIKTVEGPDDYASMEEVVFRRYNRMLQENIPLPDLIIIDGGKGQVHSAYNSLVRLNIQNKVKIVGLAKRMEEIIFMDDPIPLFLSRNSDALKLMIQIRDEVHRFGIKHHRNVRSKAQLDNDLIHVKGLGIKTIEILRQEFGSIKRIAQASDESIIKLIGKRKAEIIKQHFSLNFDNKQHG